jgi:SAM-dependent methyltransferase
MNPEERQHVVERYAERLRKMGSVVEALGWRDRAQQELRFQVLADGMPMTGPSSVLDIGCGFGDVYGYLQGLGREVQYTGCDLSPDMIAIAREKYPDASFETRDVLESPYPDRTFDFVCISGIFNHVLADNDGFLRRMLSAAFQMSRCGVVANMTTDHVDYREPHLHYFNPEAVLQFCRTLSRRVALRHDYPLYEFSVFVYRDGVIPRPEGA